MYQEKELYKVSDKKKNKARTLEEDGLTGLLPYERFLERGPEALTDEELLAIIIRTGTKDMSPVEMGHKLIKMGERYASGLCGLHHLTLEEIMSIPGIGEVKGIKLKCIAELSNRIARSKSGRRVIFRSPQDIAEYYMEAMCHREEEHVVLAFLNHQMMLLGEEEIAVGTVRSAVLSPREIFISAVKNRAVNILLLHNHPGGDPSPSAADLDMTGQIFKAGKLLDINLCDHIIIGEHRYYSFSEHNLLN